MNKREGTKHRKKKSYHLFSLLWAIVFLFVAVLMMYLYAIGGARNLWEILINNNYWLSNGVVDGLIVVGFLLVYRVDAQNVALQENDLEDTEWLTSKKLKKLKEFKVTSWEGVKESDDGIVIGAEKKKGKEVEIIMTSQLHALIVGTTGSGKTTSFVDQNIAVLARSKGKPSLIISDPKKELLSKHGNALLAEGYKISVLDLREPYSSERWNPMNVLLRRIRLVKELKAQLDHKQGKYYGAGEVFISYKAARMRIQELKDEIFENAMDLVYTLCPVQNKDQPTWEEGARNLILGLVLAFCEDCIDGKMEEKQLLLFNVYHNITNYCSENTATLKEYLLKGRDKFSKVRGLVNTVLITSDKTLTSYLSEVNSYMQQLSDDGILSLTSENDLDIVNIDEKPNAVFVIVPDERFSRHRFVTLFITQTYKELVEKANLNLRREQTETAILKRNVYFVLDEFGNLPKFDNLDGMVTVARSRGIRFLLVLQSFSQLTAKYGREVGDIVKSNCNVKIFIGSDDAETRKEFSELCGQKKIKNFSVNTSAENPASSNTGASNQPLITIGMLERLNGDVKGDAIVSVRGYEPIWAVFTPSYELKEVYFKDGTKALTKRQAVFFNKSDYVFDIHNKSVKEKEEKALDAIECMDKEPFDLDDDGESAKQVEKLDNEWQRIVDDIDEKVKKFSVMLKGVDSRALMQASLGAKPTLLYEIMENYDKLRAKRIQEMADYISSRFPKLRQLQDKANK